MPMRFDGDKPWWSYSPEEIDDMVISGRSECDECGGVCCANPSIASWDDEGRIVTKTELQAELDSRRIPWKVIRWWRAYDRVRFRYECQRDGLTCDVETRPTTCRNFPCNRIIEERKYREVEPYCALARTLRAEWLANTEVPT